MMNLRLQAIIDDGGQQEIAHDVAGYGETVVGVFFGQLVRGQASVPSFGSFE